MTKSFKDLFAEAEQDPSYWSELAILEATEAIVAAMDRAQVSRAELARRLGTSQAYITKILRGNANFTLDSLARIARALGGELRLHIARPGTQTRWFETTTTVVHAGTGRPAGRTSAKAALQTGSFATPSIPKEASYGVTTAVA